MRILKNSILLIIIFSLILSAVSCSKQLDDSLYSNSDSNAYSDGESSIIQGTNGSSSNLGGSVEHVEGSGELIKNDFSRYTVIATKTNSRVLNAATELCDKLAKKGFSLSLNKSSVYEIIIGNNVAAESKEALNELAKTDKDYLIKFSGTKILIVAKNDLILSEACDVFLDEYISNIKNNILSVKDGTATLGVSKELTTIAYDGIALYDIVVGSASSAVKAKADELAAFMKTMCGISSIKSNASYDKNKNQILIGAASYSETASVMKTLEDGKGIITKVNNKIVIAGKDDNATNAAIDSFMQLIEQAKTDNSKKGNYAISIKKTVVDTYCASLSAVPKFTGGTYSATYPSGDGISQQYYTSADSSKINAYVSQLATLGYKKVEDNSINGNRFISCYGKNGLVHISYINYNKTVTVILDSLKNSVYKASEPEYTKVTDTALAVMSLDYDTTQDKIGSNYDASGMSYVITLEDGRYIIIDGGYSKARDHHILFNYLKSNNKRKDGKIVIAAWVFTHDHSDHYGVFVDFSNTYGTQVTLEYYLMNCGDKSRYTQTPSGWLPGTSADGGLPYYCLDTYFKNAKKIVPHTGQKITFCNTTFEVMSSQESHTPSKIEWINDSSIILRMNANGVKTLFLADAEAQTTKLLNDMYGSTLKSDIMQIAHHGYSGGSTALYQNIAPKYSLWPTSQECFNQRTTGGGNGNAQTQNKWARNNTTCYVGDDNIEILSFAGGNVTVTTCVPNPTQQ